MKKTLYILSVLTLVFCSVFFSACGNALANMKLVAADGETMTLNIDVDRPNAPESLGEGIVIFSNIPDNVSREVDIYTVPSELAKCEVKKIVGNSVYYSVQALDSGNGEIVIKSRVNSKVSTKVPLKITKNLKAIVANVSEYAIKLPTTGDVQFNIPNNAFSFQPAGATSQVEYVLDKISANNVGKVTLNDNVITVKTGATEGTLHLFAKGKSNNVVPDYDINKFGEIYITVHLIQIPEVSDMRIVSSRDINNESYTTAKTGLLTMVMNQGIIETGSNNRFDQVMLTVGSMDDAKFSPIDASKFATRFEVYNVMGDGSIQLNNYAVEITPQEQLNTFLVKSLAPTRNDFATYIKFTTFRIGFESSFKCEIIIQLNIINSPDNIDVSLDDVLLTAKDGVITTTLYDTYLSLFGAKYNFTLVSNVSGVSDTFKYKISLPAKFLSNQNLGGISMDKYNLYRLIISTSGGAYLQFSVSDGIATSGYLESNTVLYFKYFTEKTNVGAGDEFRTNPSIELVSGTDNTSLVGNIFAKLKPAKMKINFDIGIGVKEISFTAYEDVLTMTKNSDRLITISIKNADGGEIASGANVKLSVSDGMGLGLYNSIDDIGSEIIFANSLSHVRSLGRVGNYSITATAPNGVTASLPILVYSPFIEENVDIVTPNSPKDGVGKIAYRGDKNVDGQIKEYYEVSTNTLLQFDCNIISMDAEYEVEYKVNDLSRASISSSGVFTAKLPTYSVGANGEQGKDYITVTITITGISDYNAGKPVFTTITKEILLFIYQPVESVVLNYDRVSVKANNTLGAYNKDKSIVTFSANIIPANAYIMPTADNMTDVSMSWTGQGSSLSAYYSAPIISTDKRSAEYTFTLPSEAINNGGTAYISLFCTQYGQQYVSTSVVYISAAVKSAGVSYEKTFATRPSPDGQGYSNYIYMRADRGLSSSTGDLNVDNITNKYVVTSSVFPSNTYDSGIKYYLVGNSKTDKPIDQIARLVGNVIVPTGVGEVRLLVVANDAIVTKFVPGVSNPNNCFSRYDIVDIVVADGSVESPYLIGTVGELLAINNPTGLTKHYALISDIYFTTANSSLTRPFGIFGDGTTSKPFYIQPFTGSIVSYESNKYGIYNLVISGGTKVGNDYYAGLFAQIGTADDKSATISNITLSLQFKLTSNIVVNNAFVGSLACINYGNIFNCNIAINNIAPQENSYVNIPKVTFGGIVADNRGVINIPDSTLIGATGGIRIITSAVASVTDITIKNQSYIGGVSGRNSGTILGSVSINVGTSTIDDGLDTSFGNEGTISDLNIKSLQNTNLYNATGGVVGYNSGIIHNVYVAGSVQGYNNVGGIIGLNESLARIGNTSDSAEETSKTFQIANSYSSVIVKGNDFVGGVVGKDILGSYYYVNSEFYYIEGKDDAGKRKDNTPGVSAANYVGGFAGSSAGGMFYFSYVVSYKSNSPTDVYYADIEVLASKANEKYVSAFIGYGESATVSSLQTSIMMVSCSSSAKLTVAINQQASNVYAGGIMGYAKNSYSAENIYSKGSINVLENSASGQVYYLAGVLGGSARNTGVELKNAYSTMIFDVTGAIKNYIFQVLDKDNSLSNGTIESNVYYYNSGFYNIINDAPAEADKKVLFGVAADTLWYQDSTVNNNLPVLANPYDISYTLSVELPISVKLEININNSKVHAISSDSIMLYYYDLKTLVSKGDTEIADEILKQNDRETLNTYSIGAAGNSGIVKINISPKSVRDTKLSAVSSNENVAKIKNGKLILVGIGKTTLTVKGQLNSSIADSITIYVENAVDSFELFQSPNVDDETYKLTGKTIQMSIDSGKSIFAKFSDVYTFDAPKRVYTYTANNNVGVSYKVSTADASILAINGVSFANAELVTENGKNFYKIDIPYSGKAYLEVLQKSSTRVRVTTTPYIQFGDQKLALKSLESEFVVDTYVGATDVKIDVMQISVSPLAQAEINVTIKTDMAGDEVVLLNEGLNGKLVFDNDGMFVADEGIDFPFKIKREIVDNVADSGEITCKYTFYTTKKYVTTIKDYKFDVYAGSASSIVNSFVITLTPQNILHMNVANLDPQLTPVNDNFQYREYSTTKLIPGDNSIVKISIYPSNSDYDFLEIKNKNIANAVSLEQVLYNGKLNDSQIVASDKAVIPYVMPYEQSTKIDGGIRLEKITYDYINSLGQISSNDIPYYYVRTLIPSSAINGQQYTLEVDAYKMVNGVKTLVTTKPGNILLEAQLIPSVVLNYENKNSNEYKDFIDIANNVSFELGYAAFNVDNVNPELTVLDSNGMKYDKVLIYFDALNNKISVRFNKAEINDTFEIKARVYRVVNGVEMNVTASLKFVVRAVTLNGIGIRDVVNDKFSKTYNENYLLETAFGAKDMTFEQNTINIEEIKNNFLGYINKNIDGNYPNWFIAKTGEEFAPLSVQEYDGLTVAFENEKIYLNGKNSNANNYQINLVVYYDYNSGGVFEYSTHVTKYKLEVVFKLDFFQSQSLQTATPVQSEQDFLEMTAGRKYILLSDITLENYIPFNRELASFDGNGYVINIKNYDTETMLTDKPTQTLRLGLFDKVYQNMIVSNVILNIPKQSVDLADVKLLNYGGLAVTNEGMITNCVVKSESVDILNLKPKSMSSFYNETFKNNTNINALYFYQSKPFTDGTIPSVNIAGLVSENAASGYITNCKVLHSIIATGHIAGVATSNQGVISATKFQFGQIKNLSERGTVANTAGFVINNTGRISTSYAEGGFNDQGNLINDIDYLQATEGGITSANDVAGFVMVNSKTIIDSFSNLYIQSNGKISGFVFDNRTGTIERCYSSSRLAISEFYTPLIGTDDNRKPLGTADSVVNCYYLVTESVNPLWLGAPLYVEKTAVTYSTVSEKYADKLNIVGVSKKLSFCEENNFINFIFANGNSINGVWTMKNAIGSNKMHMRPTLIAADTIYKTKMKLINTSIGSAGDTIYEYASAQNTGLGTRLNPYFIHDAASYVNLMNIQPDTKAILASYKMIRDIDLHILGNRPETSQKTFYGTFDGNDMIISNVSLFNDENNVESMGLFKEISSSGTSDKGFVKNLTVKPSLVKASHAKSVGTLAGVLKNGCVSSITIDAEGLVVLGENVVGGMFGQMVGNFEAFGLKSNVTVNSTKRNAMQSMYNIYNRQYKTGLVTSNIKDISYAGGIAGIVDGYNFGNENINSGTVSRIERVKYASSIGNITVVGENAGFVFGYVGESTKVSDISHTLLVGSSLAGTKNNGGLVAESRGEITNSFITYPKVVLSEIAKQNVLKPFEGSKYSTINIDLSKIAGANVTAFSTNATAGGVVAFNNGGIVRAGSTIAVTSGKTSIAGGLVGQMTTGMVENSYTSSSVYSSRFIGGAVGKISNPNVLSNNSNTGKIEYNSGIMQSLAGFGLSDKEFMKRGSFKNIIANNIWEAKYTGNIVTKPGTESADFYRVIGGILGGIEFLDKTTDIGVIAMVNENNKYKKIIYLNNVAQMDKFASGFVTITGGYMCDNNEFTIPSKDKLDPKLNITDEFLKCIGL